MVAALRTRGLATAANTCCTPGQPAATSGSSSIRRWVTIAPNASSELVDSSRNSRTYCKEIQSSLASSPCRVRMPTKVPPATRVASGHSALSRTASATVRGAIQVTGRSSDRGDGTRLQQEQPAVGVEPPLDVLGASVQVGQPPSQPGQGGAVGVRQDPLRPDDPALLHHPVAAERVVVRGDLAGHDRLAQ